MRPFGSVKEAGDQSVPFSNNGRWWPQFLFKLHKQLIFETLVRSLRLIFWLQEVTEVTVVKMKINS